MGNCFVCLWSTSRILFYFILFYDSRKQVLIPSEIKLIHSARGKQSGGRGGGRKLLLRVMPTLGLNPTSSGTHSMKFQQHGGIKSLFIVFLFWDGEGISGEN